MKTSSLLYGKSVSDVTHTIVHSNVLLAIQNFEVVVLLHAFYDAFISGYIAFFVYCFVAFCVALRIFALEMIFSHYCDLFYEVQNWSIIFIVLALRRTF